MNEHKLHRLLAALIRKKIWDLEPFRYSNIPLFSQKIRVMIANNPQDLTTPNFLISISFLFALLDNIYILIIVKQ